MIYGSTIGKKFYEDGSIRRYPGNTVVADILPGNPAYDTMCHLRQLLQEFDLEDYFIPLPDDSYHMTVIQGVNDQVRKENYWPADLPLDAPLTQADDYITEAILGAGLPGPVQMRFDVVNVSKGCCTVRLLPADETQEKTLWDFRNRAADRMNHRQPNFYTYRFHISLAYVRVIPESAAAQRLEEMCQKMNEYIARQPAFYTAAPYMAYYDDMLRFSPDRLPR